MNSKKCFIILFLVILNSILIIAKKYEANENDFIGAWSCITNLNLNDMINQKSMSNPNITKLYLIIEKIDDYYLIFLVDYKEFPANHSISIGKFDKKERYIKFVDLGSNLSDGQLIFQTHGTNELYLTYCNGPFEVEFVKISSEFLKLYPNEEKYLKRLE